MKKVFVLGSAALLILISSVPDVARGAPVGPSVECPDLCAQFIPAPAAMQDVEDSSIEIVVAPTRRQVVEGIGELIISADTGKVLVAVLYLQPVIDEVVVASCDQPISPVEIIGIARSCDDVQEVVVAGTEKVDVVRIARQTVGEAGPAVFTEMLRAVESQRQPFVKRV